ncbi:MAG: hypothetical protein BRC41_10360 [Cyanobacteria bacterium QH_9_48_43]|nr:MAG: hypothetical protein BRC41_10360 [Cyanobacteria bacterium QH_9_48_43]
MRPDHSGVKIPVTDPEKNKELEKEFQQLLEETSVPPIPGLATPEPKKVPTTPVDSKKLPNPEAGRQRKQPPKTPPPTPASKDAMDKSSKIKAIF